MNNAGEHMRVYILSLIAILFIFGCGIFRASPPPYDARTCTAIGCGFTLRIEIRGNMPSDFVLTASDSTGESANVHCMNGTTINDSQAAPGKTAICEQSGVSFLDFAPQQGTITLKWEGGEVAQSFQANYKTFRPNGPQCEPECRTATVIFLMPDQ